jgi:hypothetical protein
LPLPPSPLFVWFLSLFPSSYELFFSYAGVCKH